ncbi:metallophosphoesterase family protein [Paenibacillus glycanilyticus]|uniref:metallophosphoesterase family protein n=1 Tax=Paenibacillus glycanilyticus TaxID=126569 RepID=UPI00203A8E5A|nr:metallophosphoesterase family protein [Paenibacillus glycanilyticus]MCM3631172.1 metallophosphoesterase family protein [Paenibacillus glycanilyticus]
MENLKFRDDGTFTIVQFTDLHWQNGVPEDLQTHALIKSILREEAPDLVIFTGDVIQGEFCKDPVASYSNAISVMEEYPIPWAAVFGNHDAEKDCTKEELIAVQQASGPYCLTENGPSLGDDRLGNFVLEIHSSQTADQTAAALYLLDSGSNLQHPIGGYERITHSQIGWYKEQSKRLAEAHNGRPLPALAFFHIPVPEFKEVWANHTCYGHKYEDVCCSKLNSGMFAAFAENRDVHGIFVGHDHVNDFQGELHGIKLCYGRASGYNTYGKDGFARGARVIQLTEGESGFRTWLRLEDGSVIADQPEHSLEQEWQRI